MDLLQIISTNIKYRKVFSTDKKLRAIVRILKDEKKLWVNRSSNALKNMRDNTDKLCEEKIIINIVQENKNLKIFYFSFRHICQLVLHVFVV